MYWRTIETVGRSTSGAQLGCETKTTVGYRTDGEDSEVNRKKAFLSEEASITFNIRYFSLSVDL